MTTLSRRFRLPAPLRSLLLPALLGATLAGCATTAPVQVTRFALAPDVVRGPVAPAPAGGGLEQRSWDDAVGRQLGRLGFPFGDQASARYLVAANVTRDVRPGAIGRRGPGVGVGLGGSTGSYGSGVGLGVGINLGGGGRGGDAVVTTLSVRMRDRQTQQVVWEGRAATEARRPVDGDIDRLAAALFRDFPGPTGRTVLVP